MLEDPRHPRLQAAQLTKVGPDDESNPYRPRIQPRLLSSEHAAAYLGLGSRWAVRRLMLKGELEVVRLAGKLRFDREDLDRLIAARKSTTSVKARDERQPPSLGARRRLETMSPDTLASLRKRGGRTVTER